MFRLSLLSALVCATVASNPLMPMKPSSEISLQTSRRLENEEDISWLAKYNILYENCFHSEKSVAYRLCPSKHSCGNDCSGGGQYLADLDTFIDAFTEAQMTAREYRCEYARENCEYDDEDMCFQDDNLKYCQQDWGEELDIQEYLECKEIDDGYYVGPYCGEDNYGIYLGVFTDEDCTALADDNSAFYDAYGYELPYSSESIIGEDDCARCDEHALQEDKNEGDQEDEDNVLEQCEDLYQYTATRCERDLDVDNPDTDSCGYIEQLKEDEQVSSRVSNGYGSSSSRLWLGFLIAALVVLAFLVVGWVYLRNRKKRGTTQLGPSKENLI